MLYELLSAGGVYSLSQSAEELLDFLSTMCSVDALRNIASNSILSSIQSIMAKVHVGAASQNSRLQPTNSTASGHTLVQPVLMESLTEKFLMESDKAGNFPLGRRIANLSDATSRSHFLAGSTSPLLLDFLMHILVKYEFPSTLATFLLQLLPDANYKVCDVNRSFTNAPIILLP